MNTLFAYEVADLIDLVQTAGGEVAPEVRFDCRGTIRLYLVKTDWIVAQGKEVRRLYDHRLPVDREEAKRRSREAR